MLDTGKIPPGTYTILNVQRFYKYRNERLLTQDMTYQKTHCIFCLFIKTVKKVMENLTLNCNRFIVYLIDTQIYYLFNKSKLKQSYEPVLICFVKVCIRNYVSRRKVTMISFYSCSLLRTHMSKLTSFFIYNQYTYYFFNCIIMI